MFLKIRVQDVKNANLCYWLVMAAPLVAVFPCAGIFLSAGAYLFVLFSAFSKRQFVRAHARQALTLFILQGILAVVLLFLSADWPYYIFVLLVGIAGATGGLIQTRNRIAWMDNIRAEIREDALLSIQKPADHFPATYQNERAKVIEASLKTFRNSDQASRQTAIKTLEQLGEVETF